jgi:hypothetical protein
LSDDWEETRDRLACAAVDGPSPPLGQAVCNDLHDRWGIMDRALERCVQDLTVQSNNGANCQSFETQLASLQSSADALSSTTDPANRVAELQVRLSVMEDLYFRRVKPSYLQ